MDNDEPDDHSATEQDIPPVNISRHEPLPPPPEVKYQRPDLDRRDRSSQGMPSGDSKRPSGIGGHGAGLAAGTTFVASIFGGFLIGQFIDRHFFPGKPEWATVICILLGIISGFVNLIRFLQATDHNKHHK